MQTKTSPCPECRKVGRDTRGNNFVTWPDGHSHCFACGYREGTAGLARLKERAERNQEDAGNDPRLVLPSDYTRDLAPEGLDWLRKYDLTDQEIEDNYIGWSDSFPGLVFPCFDVGGNLVLLQKRSPTKRFYTAGKPEKVLHIIGEQRRRVCVVEDFISAIKVGRVCAATPLFGGNLSPDKARIIAHLFTSLVIWLDKDKSNYAIRTSRRVSPLFDNVQTIITDNDPKEYTTDEIREWLA